MDQVPLPFASCSQRTLEFVGTQRVWIKQPGSGLDKRQATLQLLIRGEGQQPKPVLIFRGKKKPSRHCDQQARATEAANYDKDVEVLWQPKSWADIETCVEWAEGCLTSFVALELKDEPYLLLCDNLNGQLADPFKAAMTKAGNSTLWFGPKGATHIWQPVDHHVGVRYKNMMSECYEEFLADRARGPPPTTDCCGKAGAVDPVGWQSLPGS